MSRLLARLEDFRLLPFFVLFSMAVGIGIGNALRISDFTLTPPIDAIKAIVGGTFEPTAPAPSYSDFHPNVYVDITDTYEQKMKAVAVINRTQPSVVEYYGAMARMRGREAAAWARGRRGQVQYAEGFVQDTPFTTDLLPW